MNSIPTLYNKMNDLSFDDSNAKAAVRAVKAAEDYIQRDMTTQASHELDRAKQYLHKVPVVGADRNAIQAEVDRPEAAVRTAQREQGTKRLLVLVDRHLRYAREDIDRGITGRHDHYLALARQEISKLWDDQVRTEQEHLVHQVEQEAIQTMAHRETTRHVKELERGFDRLRDMVYRAGSSLTREFMDEYSIRKLLETSAKLPDELRMEWETTIREYVESVLQDLEKESEDNNHNNIVNASSQSETITTTALASRRIPDEDDIALKIASPYFLQTPPELPELPVIDKALLPRVQDMDAMICDAHAIRECAQYIRAECDSLKERSNVSRSGTKEEIVRQLVQVIDAHQTWQDGPKQVALKTYEAFQTKYGSDDNFASTYREIYNQADEALQDVIDDNRKRREVSSHMHNTYKYYSTSANAEQIKSMMEEGEELRSTSINSFLQSVDTDLMLADYKKGNDLVELLQGTRTLLQTLQPLVADSPKDEDRIKSKLQMVTEKEVGRKRDIVDARAAYRLAERSMDAPENATELESIMKTMLERRREYHVHEIRTASGWIDVRNALGVFLYAQIDFYVAGRYAGETYEDDNQLDVYYVTGKSDNEHNRNGFSRYFIACVGDMLAANL